MAFNVTFQRFLLITCLSGFLGLYVKPSSSANIEEDKMTVALQAYDAGRYAEAFTNWQTVANQGNTIAMIALANMYAQGEGRSKDPVRATLWYQKAAKLGNMVARLNYAQMLEKGLGIKASRVDAYIWYSLAGLGGNQWAQDRRLALASELTPSEKRTAATAIKREKLAEK